MVAGGIGLNPNGQTVPLNSAETFTLSPTLPTGSWFQEAVLPDRLTGSIVAPYILTPTLPGNWFQKAVLPDRLTDSTLYPKPDSSRRQLVPGSRSTKQTHR
jgi:hypothetical protein